MSDFDPFTFTRPDCLDDHSVDLLRDVAAWANGQREDYWFPSPPRKPMNWRTVIGVYLCVVRHLGSTIEEVTADTLPFPWRSYDEQDRAAINYVRVALGLRPKK